MRVVIGEDEGLMRQGLTLLLRNSGIEVVATAADGESVVAETARNRPDVVVTDIRMPPDHKDEGLRAALQIKEDSPEIGVVVLSHHVQRAYTTELLSGHASGIGYLLKQRVMNIDSFIRDLHTVAAGGTVLDPEVVTLLMVQARSASSQRLTPTQERVLSLMARGLSNLAISREVHITEKSVVRHVSNIYDLLGLQATPESHRRVQAVVQHLWQ